MEIPEDEQRGTWGQERQLIYTIKADRNHLAAAPLGPVQKKRLADKIAFNVAELARIRKERREAKKKGE